MARKKLRIVDGKRTLLTYRKFRQRYPKEKYSYSGKKGYVTDEKKIFKAYFPVAFRSTLTFSLTTNHHGTKIDEQLRISIYTDSPSMNQGIMLKARNKFHELAGFDLTYEQEEDENDGYITGIELNSPLDDKPVHALDVFDCRFYKADKLNVSKKFTRDKI